MIDNARFFTFFITLIQANNIYIYIYMKGYDKNKE